VVERPLVLVTGQRRCSCVSYRFGPAPRPGRATIRDRRIPGKKMAPRYFM